MAKKSTLGAYPLHTRAVRIFVLYNRYTGKLRFFGNHFVELGSGSTPQNVDLRIDISSDNKNGMFRHLGSFDVALDQPTKYSRLFSSNEHPGSNQRFFSSDFQLGYDPCVCEYESELTFRVQKNTSWNVNLHGRSLSMTGTMDEYPDDFLTNRSWYDDSTTEHFGGSLIYKNLSRLHDKYTADMEAYEVKLATYNKPQSILAREIISLSKTLAINGLTGAFLPSTPVKNEVEKFMKKIDGNFDKDNAELMAKGIRKTADAILGKGFDFLTQQYVNPNVLNKPVKPSMPTATFSEMVIGGKITHSSRYDLFTTSSPGSFKPGVHSFTGYNYPIYNKPVGLYALLKTPKIAMGIHNEQTTYEIEEYRMDWMDDVSNFGYNNQVGFGIFGPLDKSVKYQDVLQRIRLDFKQEIAFHLDEKLLYKLNRNLDINDDKSNVLISFQLEFKSKMPSKLYFEPDWDIYNPYWVDNLPAWTTSNDTIGKDLVNDVTLSNSNLEVLSHSIKTRKGNQELITLELPWEKIDKSSTNVFTGTLTYSTYFPIALKHIRDRKRLYGSNVIDSVLQESFAINNIQDNALESKLRALYNSKNASPHPPFILDYLTEITNSYYKYNLKSVKMKIMTDLTFEQESSQGGEVNTTQVFTYLIYDADKNIDLIESNGRWLTALETDNLIEGVSFPSTIHIGNEVITPSSSHVSFVEGNKLYVCADKIFINGQLSVLPGYIAILRATEKVELLAGAFITRDILIETGERYEYFSWRGLTKEATNAEVSSFCSNNNEYKARQSNALFIPNDNNDDDNFSNDNEDVQRELFNSFYLYPNPNSGTFNVDFERNLVIGATLTLTDLTGRVLHTETLLADQRVFNVQTYGLADGIYFVTIKQGNERKTQKVVIQTN